jgi:hypothetical protein
MCRQNSTRHETEQYLDEASWNELEETRWKEAQAGIDDLLVGTIYRPPDPRDFDPLEEHSRLVAAEAAYLRGY